MKSNLFNYDSLVRWVWATSKIVAIHLFLLGMLSLVARSSSAQIVISEIMYNPQGTDRVAGEFSKEWVEIYNTGTSAVDLSGWTLEDLEDNSVSSAFPVGTMLAGNSALVLTGDSATFDANWGTGINRLQLSNFPVLANSPSFLNEHVAIRDSFNSLQDQVNYDDEGAWPTDDGSDGASIFLKPGSLSANFNDNGANWLPSMAGVYGSRFVGTEDDEDENHGSPGYVQTQAQSPMLPSANSAWSMVIMPDIQNYAKSSTRKAILNEMTQWIDDNRAAWNVQLVLQEGDLVNNNDTTTPTSGDQTSAQQWQNVKDAFQTLDGQVPYVLATGNHDYGTTNAQNRATKLNEFFSLTDNSLVDPGHGGILQGVMEPGSLENAYYEFKAPDGREILVISLEWGPRQQAIDWANQVVGQNKFEDHTAILLTHAYMYHDETRYDVTRNNDGDPTNDQSGNPHFFPTSPDTNDGEELWNELVKLHGNFEFVFSGHVGGDGLGQLTSAGDEGNLVHQMLFNTQFESSGGNGWVRVLEFLDDGQTVRVRTFSPHYGLQKTDVANDFTLQISALASITGDFNLDGNVDGSDLLLWQRGGSPDPLSSSDLAVWQSHFGNSSPPTDSLATTFVPEPSSLLLVFMLGASTQLLYRTRRV